MSETELLDIVEAQINQHQPSGYRLDVRRQEVKKDGEWWYVVVQPDSADVKARDYTAIMEQVEDDLESQKHIKVLLVPALPGD